MSVLHTSRGQTDSAEVLGLDDVYALQRLSGGGGASVVSVAQYLGVSGSVASRRLSRMVTAGLVEACEHPMDSRALLMELTERGREVLDDYAAAVQDALGLLADDLDFAALEARRRDLPGGAARLALLARDAEAIADEPTTWRWVAPVPAGDEHASSRLSLDP